MPDYGISALSEDPLGLATTKIQLKNLNDGNDVKQFAEHTNFQGVWIDNAVVEQTPIEQAVIEYELHDTATLNVVFGALVNSDWIITAASCNDSNTALPRVTLTAIKFSDNAKFKAYVGGAVNKSFTGGYGVKNLYGATVAGSNAAISSSWSIEIQTAEAMEQEAVAGVSDYHNDGYYLSGFKESVSIEAYGAITEPASSYVTETPLVRPADDFNTYSLSFWKYLHSVTI